MYYMHDDEGYQRLYVGGIAVIMGIFTLVGFACIT